MNPTSPHLFAFIHEKCVPHGLHLVPSETMEGEYYITNKDKSKALRVHILTPETYLPDRQESPHDIETACKFQVSSLSLKSDFLLLAWQSNQGQTSFLIVQGGELQSRFDAMNKQPDSDGYFPLTIYAGSDGFILDATNISAEGEWYFFGGRMGKDSKWDFSMYLYRWEVVFDVFRLP